MTAATAALAESDETLVAAWLRVGGSWAAIATAHGADDVAAVRQRVEPYLHPYDDAPTAPAHRQRPAQLQLF